MRKSIIHFLFVILLTVQFKPVFCKAGLVVLSQKQDDGFWNKISTLIKQGKLNEAKTTIDSTLEVSTDQNDLARLHNAKGVIFKKEGDFNQALAAYELSLAIKLELKNESEVAKTLQNIANVYRRLNLTDSAFSYYQQSINIKRKYSDPISLANTLLNLGHYYFQTNNWMEAGHLYEEVRTIATSSNNTRLNSLALESIGNCYHAQDFYDLALSYYFSSLNLKKRNEHLESKAGLLLNIASTFSKKKDFKEAAKYFELCARAYQNTEVEYEKGDLFYNWADALLFEKEAVKALDLLEKAEEYFQLTQNQMKISDIYHARAKARVQLAEFDQANSLFDKSIFLKKELHDSLGLGQVLNSLAVSQHKEGLVNSAKRNYQTANSIAKKYSQLRLEGASYLGLSEVCESLNQQDSSLYYFKKHKTVQDSLFQLETARQSEELKEKYESEKKDLKISDLELTNRVVSLENQNKEVLLSQERSEKQFYLIVGALLILILIGMFFYIRNKWLLAKLQASQEKRRRNEEIGILLQEQETNTLVAMVKSKDAERKRIAQELHDHFGSLLAAIRVNLNALDSSEESLGPVPRLVDQACDDVRNMSHTLAVGIADDFGLDRALTELTDSLKASGKIIVEYHATLCKQKLESHIEIAIYRIIQELISNVLKHAQANKLSIHLTCIDNNMNIIVEDDGLGFEWNESQFLSGGIGLSGLRKRVKNLSGEIKIDSYIGRGTAVIVDLPVNDQLVEENE